MTQVLAVAAGGAAGSVLRYWMSTLVHGWLGREFPYGTLAVNVIGCLIAGALFIVFLERLAPDHILRAGIMIGVLGGFTTFSAFSVDTYSLISEGATLKGFTYIAASVVLSIGATWLGVVLGKQI